MSSFGSKILVVDDDDEGEGDDEREEEMEAALDLEREDDREREDGATVVAGITFEGERREEEDVESSRGNAWKCSGAALISSS